MKWKPRTIFINIFPLILIFFSNLTAQDSTNTASHKTSKIDTTRLFSDKPYKSPLGAVLRSAVVPGWGQYYNESYIKAGVALTVNAALISAILYNNNKWQTEGDVNFRNKRDTFIWIWGLAYLLTLADAYVDANLYGFDEAMGISYLPPVKDKHPGMLAFRIRF